MNSSDGMLIVNVSAIQAVAIAAVTYYFGAWLRKVPFLEKYSVPSPVVGGMLVALVLSCLEYFHFMKVNFDTSLQTLLMLAFFTTIGLSASLKIVTEGGKLLVSFLFVITILCVLQNFLGMGLAEMMGLDFHYGLLAGSVSMMGGLGTSAAFGPYFEQTYGVQGGTAVAITAATFGMVVAVHRLPSGSFVSTKSLLRKKLIRRSRNCIFRKIWKRQLLKERKIRLIRRSC